MENKLSFQGTIIWMICAIFFTYEFLLRTVLGTFQQPIMHDLKLSHFSFATLSTTSYLMIYGIMQIPVSIIIGKYGLKRSLLFAIGVCIFSAALLSYSHELKTAIIARMLMGLGSSFGFICLLIAVYDWMPKKHYGLFIGLSQFIGTMGPMIAAGPLNSLATESNANWRTTLFSLGVLGIPLAIMVICFAKNNQNSANKFRIISKSISATKNLSSLLIQKQTWFIAIYSALVYFIIEYLSENEGKTFLEINGYSGHFSSYMITLGWLGYAIGCPLLGFLSDLLKRRKLIMITAAFLCFSSLISIVYFTSSGRIILALSFFGLGIGASGQSIGFAIMAEQCNKIYLAVGIGFNNTMITLLTSVVAPIFGWILSHHSHNTGKLNLADYHFTFALLAGLISISFVLAVFFIKETFCRSTKGFTLIEASAYKTNFISA
ncbi:MAG: MFS transporter [Gammaproteobacteria bacterium 39-13]|nr:MFS transporter [Gammaproteobacteria bacterium]OJV91570.1 MAG: MFS transporter [Gammaproteobacteria bacterium 39-13]